MTKIEWTEATWNPIVGCSIVSPGCTNCYAMRMAARLEAMSKTQFPHYQGTTKASKAGAVWTGKVAMARDATLAAPLRRKKPTMYFVNSMGDLFHEDVPDAWIDRVFAVMALCPQHTFQVLTKRAARMRRYFDDAGEVSRQYFVATAAARMVEDGDTTLDVISAGRWPLPNVWLGVSAERQQEADARIPDLLATPAAVRFVSAEPLLGPIDFSREWLRDKLGGAYPFPMLAQHERTTRLDLLDWIIVGGESGPDARPMHPDWARAIRDQCSAADVAFFFKQWGEWREAVSPHPVDDGSPVASFDVDPSRQVVLGTSGRSSLTWYADQPRDIIMQRIGKARAGRLLDGRLHDAMPATQRSEVAA